MREDGARERGKRRKRGPEIMRLTGFYCMLMAGKRECVKMVARLLNFEKFVFTVIFLKTFLRTFYFISIIVCYE